MSTVLLALREEVARARANLKKAYAALRERKTPGTLESFEKAHARLEQAIDLLVAETDVRFPQSNPKGETNG